VPKLCPAFTLHGDERCSRIHIKYQVGRIPVSLWTCTSRVYLLPNVVTVVVLASRDTSVRPTGTNTAGTSHLQYVYLTFRATVAYVDLACKIISWLTQWSRVHPQKLRGPHLVENFPALYGTRKFITAFTSAHHLSLCWARAILSRHQIHFLKIHFNIMLLAMHRSSRC
jgi:hypothetical protein